jgi:hypothetical protein
VEDPRRHHDFAMTAVVQEGGHFERMEHERRLVGVAPLTPVKLLGVDDRGAGKTEVIKEARHERFPGHEPIMSVDEAPLVNQL